MVDLPISFKVPVPLAHPAVHVRPGSVKRQTSCLLGRAADRPVGCRVGRTRAGASADVSFAHVLCRPVVVVVAMAAHRSVEDVEPYIHGLAYGCSVARPEINTPLQETHTRVDAGERIRQVRYLRAE